MKKIYSKPDIVFESFSLCTSIAGPCGIKTWTPVHGTCAFDFAGETVFTSSVSGCQGHTIVDSGEYNGICYHVPAGSNGLFNS